MTVTPRRQVLDSGEFVAHEYEAELFEGRNYDTDVRDDMHRAATRLVNRELRTFWASNHYVLLGVGRDTYHRVTLPEDGTVRVGSVLIPSVTTAKRVWEAVIARITADDIEEEARRA